MQVMPSDSDALFRTVADPTRRHILDLLAERGPLTVGELAAEFPDLVASGISKHLMNLRAASLVSAARRGRQQIYRLEPDALVASLTPWIAKYEQYWSAALERLHDVAQEHGTTSRRTSQKKARRRRQK
jgi:DNA-binding transcriptional ArsR family regulator